MEYNTVQEMLTEKNTHDRTIMFFFVLDRTIIAVVIGRGRSDICDGGLQRAGDRQTITKHPSTTAAHYHSNTW